MAKRKTPELKLNPEENIVLSQDFNLFYEPQTRPLPAGVEQFAKGLQSFVDGAGSKMVIGSEVKMKKSEQAKALTDYNDFKLKFRDAVKKGDITKEANPYYLEKYKELTLNSFANQFSEKALQRYQELRVGENLEEGAFESFYKDELKAFIKDKNLGFFKPEELEQGFFKETSQYRTQLEATHKSNLLQNFKKNADAKITERVIGIIQKFKNYDTSLLADDNVDKFELIADALQTELDELYAVTGDGKASIDQIFKGLMLWAGNTEEYEFALEVIDAVPELLIGGTDTIEDIGRLKLQTSKMKKELIEKTEERLANENKLEKSLEQKERIETYDFLEKSIKDAEAKGETFSVTEYKNHPDRTNAQRDSAEAFLKDEKFDGGNSDNPEVERDIFNLLKDGKWEEASKLVSEAFRNGDLRKTTKTAYLTNIIPDAMNYKEDYFLNIPFVKKQFEAFEKIVASGKYGDVSKAVTGSQYLRKALIDWVKANEAMEGGYDKDRLFAIEFEKVMKEMQMYGGFDEMFGNNPVLTGEGTLSTENLAKKIELGKKNDESTPKLTANQIAEMTLDLNNKGMTDADFKTKYGMTRQEFQKEIGKTKKVEQKSR